MLLVFTLCLTFRLFRRPGCNWPLSTEEPRRVINTPAGFFLSMAGGQPCSVMEVLLFVITVHGGVSVMIFCFCQSMGRVPFYGSPTE